jgi:hypothetical protein
VSGVCIAFMIHAAPPATHLPPIPPSLSCVRAQSTTQSTTYRHSEDQFFRFLEFAFNSAELKPICAIMMLAYLERHLAGSGLTFHESNWVRLLLGALILASKVWDDHAVWNVDFRRVFPDVDVVDL